MSTFSDYLAEPSVDSLATRAAGLYSMDSGQGAMVQTAATVIAMRELERTVVRLDEVASSIATRTLWLAGLSLVVSVAAVIVAALK